jgi:hypothetical protein
MSKYEWLNHQAPIGLIYVVDADKDFEVVKNSSGETIYDEFPESADANSALRIVLPQKVIDVLINKSKRFFYFLDINGAFVYDKSDNKKEIQNFIVEREFELLKDPRNLGANFLVSRNSAGQITYERRNEELNDLFDVDIEDVIDYELLIKGKPDDQELRFLAPIRTLLRVKNAKSDTTRKLQAILESIKDVKIPPPEICGSEKNDPRCYGDNICDLRYNMCAGRSFLDQESNKDKDYEEINIDTTGGKTVHFYGKHNIIEQLNKILNPEKQPIQPIQPIQPPPLPVQPIQPPPLPVAQKRPEEVSETVLRQKIAECLELAGKS